MRGRDVYCMLDENGNDKTVDVIFCSQLGKLRINYYDEIGENLEMVTFKEVESLEEAEKVAYYFDAYLIIAKEEEF